MIGMVAAGPLNKAPPSIIARYMDFGMLLVKLLFVLMKHMAYYVCSTCHAQWHVPHAIYN